MVKIVSNKNELNICFEIRKKVFVDEQKVPIEVEIDKFDSISSSTKHILLIYKDTPVGTARLRIIDSYGKIERVCVLKEYRKLGLGAKLIEKLEEIAIQNNLSSLKMHSQIQAQSFYKKLNYESTGPIFLEDGIDHVLMFKNLKEVKKSHSN